MKQTAFDHLTNLTHVGGFCQVGSRSTTSLGIVHVPRPGYEARAFYDALPLGFLRTHSNASCIRKSYSQTNKNCLCISNSPFNMSLYGREYHCKRYHIALIARYVAVTTNFQPLLEMHKIELLQPFYVDRQTGYRKNRINLASLCGNTVF